MSRPTPPPDVLAEMYAPAGRRWLGLAVLYALGAALIILAVAQPPASAVWVAVLIAMGLAVLWGAEKMRQATAHGVRLTEEGLWETGGRRIIALDNIESVDRGAFAFKPSNGFLVKAKQPQQAAWRPGLYWTVGRRVGVGGVTSRAQARLMSDAIASLLADRQG